MTLGVTNEVNPKSNRALRKPWLRGRPVAGHAIRTAGLGVRSPRPGVSLHRPAAVAAAPNGRPSWSRRARRPRTDRPLRAVRPAVPVRVGRPARDRPWPRRSASRAAPVGPARTRRPCPRRTSRAPNASAARPRSAGCRPTRPGRPRPARPRTRRSSPPRTNPPGPACVSLGRRRAVRVPTPGPLGRTPRRPVPYPSRSGPVRACRPGAVAVGRLARGNGAAGGVPAAIPVVRQVLT